MLEVINKLISIFGSNIQFVIFESDSCRFTILGEKNQFKVKYSDQSVEEFIVEVGCFWPITQSIKAKEIESIIKGE